MKLAAHAHPQQVHSVMAVTITHLVVCDGVVLEGAEMGP
jgi:hypothetical protein